MIQELFGSAELIGGDRKTSINGFLEASPSPSLSPSPSSSTTTTPTTSSASENQTLKCPRCDSPNTKFCYYNNYNLTQPRHFCKTCRRYWTKGGALRNIPIGGGCRKNKNGVVAAASAGKSSSGRLKLVSPEFIKSGLAHELPSNPIMWTSPQNSHLLSILRSTQNPNPNPNPISNSVNMKEDVNAIIGTHMSSESAVATGSLNTRTIGLDFGASIGLWRNNNQQQAQQYHQQNHFQHQQNGFNILGEAPNTCMQDLYQRLKSSANYYSDHSPLGLSNVCSSSLSSSAILESNPAAGGELGYWNPTLSWSDLSTTNGTAYP